MIKMEDKTMKKNYMNPEMTVLTIEMSSHLMDGSVLGVSETGGYQEGALAPKRRTPVF